MKKNALVVTLLLAACAPAPAVPPQQLGVVAPEQRFEIFSTGKRITADSVHVMNDTLFAQEIAVHPSAPRTPVILPLLQVDSLRRAHTDRSALTSTLAPAVAIIAIGVAMGLAWGSD